MNDKIRATARVQVTLELDASAWGSDCSIGQLYKQAEESAMENLARIMMDVRDRCRIIAPVKVVGVITNGTEFEAKKP